MGALPIGDGFLVSSPFFVFRPLSLGRRVFLGRIFFSVQAQHVWPRLAVLISRLKTLLTDLL
jgi:hypothetical protein